MDKDATTNLKWDFIGKVLADPGSGDSGDSGDSDGCSKYENDDQVLKDVDCKNYQCNGVQIRCEDASKKCCDATKAKACSKCG